MGKNSSGIRNRHDRAQRRLSGTQLVRGESQQPTGFEAGSTASLDQPSAMLSMPTMT